MATTKQHKVVKKILENTGMSVSKAMAESGYPPATAKNPQQLTNSKGWKELMKEYLPDDLLAQKHQELLNKTEITGDIDTQAVSKGLDMAYKLKGSYAAEKTLNVTVELDATLTQEDVELIKLIREHDRNSTAKAIPSTGHIHDGMDSQPQD